MRRWRERAESWPRWALPGAGLVLVPKCPLCATMCGVAATWYGVSVEVANGVRIGLLAASVGGLIWAIFRRRCGAAPAAEEPGRGLAQGRAAQRAE